MRRQIVAVVAVLLVAISNAWPTGAEADMFAYSGTTTNVTLGPGTYDITAYGSQGGGGGGLGAEMKGEFNFQGQRRSPSWSAAWAQTPRRDQRRRRWRRRQFCCQRQHTAGRRGRRRRQRRQRWRPWLTGTSGGDGEQLGGNAAATAATAAEAASSGGGTASNGGGGGGFGERRR